MCSLDIWISKYMRPPVCKRCVVLHALSQLPVAIKYLVGNRYILSDLFTEPFQYMWRDLWKRPLLGQKSEMRFLRYHNLHTLKCVYTKFHRTFLTTSAVNRWRINCCRRSLQRWAHSDVASQHSYVTAHGHRASMPMDATVIMRDRPTAPNSYPHTLFGSFPMITKQNLIKCAVFHIFFNLMNQTRTKTEFMELGQWLELISICLGNERCIVNYVLWKNIFRS